MNPLRVTGLPGRRRVYFGARRVHHGATGMVLATGGVVVGGPVGAVLVVVGMGLMVHDRHDLRRTLWLLDG